MRPRLRALVAVALAATAVAGCTQREGPPPQLAVTTTEARTTTTVAGATAPASTLPGLTPSAIKAALESAVSARSFCAFAAALDDAVPDVNDGSAVTSTYEAIDAAVKEARAFVPAELADDWTVVISGVDQGVAASERVGGNLADPSLRAPFTDGDFETAMTSVESWADTHCTS